MPHVSLALILQQGNRWACALHLHKVPAPASGKAQQPHPRSLTMQSKLPSQLCLPPTEAHGARTHMPQMQWLPATHTNSL